MTKQEEKKEARKALQEEGFFKFFFADAIRYWKEKPVKAFSQFFFWGFITYAVFTLIFAINYDFSYCKSNIPEANGKQLYTYNIFVERVNEYNEQLSAAYAYGYGDVNLLNTDPKYTLECTYDLQRWKQDFNWKTLLDEWKIVFLKQ